MKVYQKISDFTRLPYAVVTQGTFDGVHAGHQKIISQLKKRAIEANGETVVLTFFPHPRMVLFPDDPDIKLINTVEENIELLGKEGIQHLIVLEFTEALAKLSALHFVRDILVNGIGTRHLIIGYDHRFGRNREGSFNDLQEYSQIYGFNLEKINEVDVNDITVSSTKIRNAILTGDIRQAAAYMNKNYTLKGTVVPGKKLGKTIGFPTANIHVPESYKIVPADGVYAVRVTHKNVVFGGMLNIGNNPTVDGINRTIEVNIFNFESDIYGDRIQVEFIQRLREGQKFISLEALKAQLLIDKHQALEILF